MPRAPHHCGFTGCTVLLPAGVPRCPEHRIPRWGGGLNAVQGHGSTRAQRKLIAVVLAEEPICTRCHNARSVEAGHIIPRIVGGRYTRENLTGRCRACNLADIQDWRRDLA